MVKLKTKQYTLSPNDQLPHEVSDTKELIEKITRKVTINSEATNLNSVFPWVSLAESILERYLCVEGKLILNLQFNLATVLLQMGDYDKSKVLIINVIKTYLKMDKVNKKKLSVYYLYYGIILQRLGEYDTAKINIEKAINLNKNSYDNYCVLANILSEMEKIKEAEYFYKKALKICIIRKGKEHTATAIIKSHYGSFLYSTGKTILAKKYLNKAYQISSKNLGKENLYTVRKLGHISNILFTEKKYSEAFEMMKNVFISISKILGHAHNEAITCKINCGKMLVKMNKYSEAIDYLENPFIIIGKKEITILLDYNEKTMIAPEVIFVKKGIKIQKIIKILENKGVPIVEKYILAKKMTVDCNQYCPIPEKYWNEIAGIMAKILKNCANKKTAYNKR